MRAVAAMMISSGCLLLATLDETPIGMLGVIVTRHPMLNIIVGIEVIWWVEPLARVGGGVAQALFHAAELWAKGQGATRMQFGAYRDPALERLYRRWGYHAMEVIYEKELV